MLSIKSIEVSLSGLSENTRRVYHRHIQIFTTWLEQDHQPLTREAVQLYLSSRSITTSSWNQSLAAIKRLSLESGANGSISRDEAERINNIPSKTIKGQKAGVWLSKSQAKEMIGLPDQNSLRGARDSAVLHLLLGSGVRRFELSGLRWSQLKWIDERWRLLNIAGKGGRIRTVSLPDWCVVSLFNWAAWMLYVEPASLIADGFMFRSFRWKSIRSGLSDSAVRDIVLAYSSSMMSRCTPHDLRRTFSKLARKGKAPLEIIQQSLGHASVRTTEIYTNAGEEANAGDYVFIEEE